MNYAAMNMNRNGPLSPMSASGSDWSGISNYKNAPENGSLQRSQSNTGGPGMNGMNGMNGINGMMANPSPPSSVGRSSQGNGLYDDSPRGSTASRGGSQAGFISGRRDTAPQEEAEFAQQHAALKRLLDPSVAADKNSAKAKKAREKLLRLTKIQFQELSTDVYDELQRRQGSSGDRLSSATTLTTNTEAAATPYLMPKSMYHPKRNQARQKLSTLPTMRFRDLATDVFFELERRYPQFAGESISRGQSPSGSVNGRQQPPTIMEEGRRGLGAGLNNTGASGGAQNSLGRPLPKTYQSNTVIPNKSTMVEDTDDGGDDEDDYEAFGLEERLRGINGRKTSTSTNNNGDGRDSVASSASNYTRNDADKKIIADYQAQVASLQQKIEKLESAAQEKDNDLKRLRDGESKWREEESRLMRQIEESKESVAEKESSLEKEFTDLKLELDSKLADAQNLNLSMQNELSRLRAEKEDLERNRNISRNDQGGDGGEWQAMYAELQQKYEDLKDELREQQEITDEVRSQATAFLQEMKGMSQSSSQSFEQQEKHRAQISKLQEEIRDWKTRYTKVRTQLRAMKSASIGLTGMPAMSMTKDNSFHDQEGKVDDILITRFQVVIDELLRTARQEPKKTVDLMQGVVIATKNITKCVDDIKETDQKIAKLKERVSATANNLVTAIRNHSMAEGLSPVSILDAAASHLNAAIVELLRVVKIKPTPSEELEIGDIPEEDEEAEDSAGGSMTNYDMMKPLRAFRDANGMSPARTSGDSIYSSSSRNSSRYSAMNRNSPRMNTGNWGMKRERNLSSGTNGLGIERAPAFGIRTNQNNVEELKGFLISQTNGVIECIQRLLHEIRSGESNISELRGHIDDIAHVVGKVIQSTETSMSQTGNTMLRERADWIVKSLSECRNNMLKMKDENPGVASRAEKEFNSKLAGHCFAMAKETKELVTIVEDISYENVDDGDLR